MLMYLYDRLEVQLLPVKKVLLWLLSFGNKKYVRKAIRKDKFRLMTRRSALQIKILKKVFGPNVSGVVFKTFNGVLINCPEDVQINEELGYTGAYNKEKQNFIFTLLRPDSVVYVIGAHIGTLAIPVSKIVQNVIAIEANPRTFEYLQFNIGLNGLTNIKAFNLCIFDRETEM
jgi:hypothetical protein